MTNGSINPLDRGQLEVEIAGRIKRLQALMAEKDLGAVIVVGGGAAGPRRAFPS